jgi:hypothetical protein
MARAGVGPIIPDRKAPPPKFTPPPPKFSLPPRFTPPPPKFTLPPPPPRTITSEDRRNMNSVGVPKPIHPALKDRVDSQGNLKVSADAAEALIRNYDSKKATPPPPPPPPRFTNKPDPVKPPGLPQSPDAIEEWLEPDPGDTEERNSNPVQSQPFITPPPPPPPPLPKIKVAPIDTVLFDDDAVPKEIIADLLFENIGGQEILTIARHDTVNGQTVLYQPIKNINILQQQYNPNNLLKLRDTSDTIFGNFTINLSAKIPQVGNGTNGANTYIDTDGNIVIEFVSLNADELVEVQLTSSGTIYEAG